MLGKKVIKVTVAGEECYIRPMNGGKIAARVIELMRNIASEPHTYLEMGALLVCVCLCDSEGKRLYGNDQVDEIREEASSDFLKEFIELALDISGLGEEPGAKNSETVQ